MASKLVQGVAATLLLSGIMLVTVLVTSRFDQGYTPIVRERGAALDMALRPVGWSPTPVPEPPADSSRQARIRTVVLVTSVAAALDVSRTLDIHGPGSYAVPGEYIVIVVGAGDDAMSDRYDGPLHGSTYVANQVRTEDGRPAVEVLDLR